MTTIVLADDHHVVRQSLRSLLEASPGLSVVGEAGDGLEAVDQVDRLRPDVLVVDLMMPGLNGLEAIRQVAERHPATRIIVLSMHSSEAYVLEALRNGAAAYVLKDARAEDLLVAVSEVTAGRKYLCSPLTERAVDVYVEKAKSAAPEPYDTLTPREREVLQLAAEGLNNTEISVRLSISPRTAETHRANVVRKLGLRTHTDVVRYAIRRGILPLER